MRNTAGKKSVMLGILASVMVFASIVYSHCQVPCGIYDDPVRFDMIAENITTIEKSMKQITDFRKKTSQILIRLFTGFRTRKNTPMIRAI